MIQTGSILSLLGILGLSLAGGYGGVYFIKNYDGSWQEISEEKALRILDEQDLASTKEDIDLNTLNDIEPSYKSVSQEDVSQEDVSKGKYSGKLISPIRKMNVYKLVEPELDGNAVWWEWAFRNKYLRQKGIEFNKHFVNLEVGYSKTSNPKALNHACKEAYGDKLKNFNKNENNIVTNIASFCTSGFKKVDLSEPASITYLPKEDVGRDLLKGMLAYFRHKPKMAKNIPTNKDWWIWRHDKTFNNKVNKSNLTAFFKDVSKGYEDRALLTANGQGYSEKQTGLNFACENSYRQSENTLNKDRRKLFNEILKFCTVLNLTEEEIAERNKEPSFITFADSKDEELNKTYTNKFLTAGNNKNNLVKHKFTGDAAWWDWNYFNRFPHDNEKTRISLSDTFQFVIMGYQSDAVSGIKSHKSLNQACDTAYKKTVSDLRFLNNRLLNEIKTFCTVSSFKKTLALPA